MEMILGIVGIIICILAIIIAAIFVLTDRSEDNRGPSETELQEPGKANSASGLGETEEPGNVAQKDTTDYLLTPERVAGREGEIFAKRVIQGCLAEGDYLLTSVSGSYDGQSFESDIVVVNTGGIFVFEVKNYKGILEGAEEDYEWTKYNLLGVGNQDVRMVKNPLRQVRRQCSLMARMLETCGIMVWVEGYAMLLENNAPFEHENIVTSPEEIEQAIRKKGKNHLTHKQVEDILRILES